MPNNRRLVPFLLRLFYLCYNLDSEQALYNAYYNTMLITKPTDYGKLLTRFT